MRYQRKTKPAIWQQAFPGQVQQKPEAKPRRICSVSKRNAPDRARYAREAREYVADRKKWGITCVVVDTIPELFGGFRYGHPISNKLTEVHHQRGRTGALLMDKRYWQACSKAGHRWIHEHPGEAQKHGWIAQLGEWGKQEL